jgi:hypothetical protein
MLNSYSSFDTLSASREDVLHNSHAQNTVQNMNSHRHLNNGTDNAGSAHKLDTLDTSGTTKEGIDHTIVQVRDEEVPSLRLSEQRDAQYGVQQSPSSDGVEEGSSPQGSLDVEEAGHNEDISLEILEEGGDEKEPPEFTDSDAAFADLKDVFGRLVSRPHSVPRESVADPRWTHETSGGDYARFAPNSCRDFLVSHYKTRPKEHVQLVLSKRGDVSITARHRALDIVKASIGEAGATPVRRG